MSTRFLSCFSTLKIISHSKLTIVCGDKKRTRKLYFSVLPSSFEFLFKGVALYVAIE
jgi:hypothetical protein